MQKVEIYMKILFVGLPNFLSTKVDLSSRFFKSSNSHSLNRYSPALKHNHL